MKIQLEYKDHLVADQCIVYLISSKSDIASIVSRTETIDYVRKKLLEEQPGFLKLSDNPATPLYLVIAPDENQPYFNILEHIRRHGARLWKEIQEERIFEIQVSSLLENHEYLLALTEGLCLSAYEFKKYKSSSQSSKFQKVAVVHDNIEKEQIDELRTLIEAVFLCRDLVNEPYCSLNAEKLSEIILNTGKEAGFSVEVFEKKKIEALRMGGLMAVSAGSVALPTFTVLEYKPDKSLNRQPLIFVGKGVVFDSGGLSIKTAEGMETMKADMAGAAVVNSLLFAVAKNKLPLHVIGLIPATDNMPGSNALAPGDVITMMNGKTVEVLNTDAEGRLILADALCYAARYDPELVVDLATLTGAAARAIGKEAMALMGTAGKDRKQQLTDSGAETHERTIEFPLWEEYGSYLESDIADIKNIGSSSAGLITAGKFLEFFTDYPWIHLDIAGVAYLNSKDHYRTKNASGTGVRMLYKFVKKLAG